MPNRGELKASLGHPRAQNRAGTATTTGFDSSCKSALPPTSDEVQPPRDLWPALARRLESPRRWVWFEVSLAAAVVLALLMFPDWFLILALPSVTEGTMRPHPYLRAYMAGIVVPTAFLLVIMIVFAYFRFYFEVPSQFVVGLPGRPLERAIVFPMAVVPNLWGVWNMVHLALPARRRLALGLHGALLPLILVPAGVTLARLLDVFTIQLGFALPIIPIGMAVYYLVWKHFVGFLNAEVGIA